MTFTETALAGAFVIDVEPVADARGFFARTWCRREFEARGLTASMAQCSVSFNARRGTLRGMHYQVAPSEEAKLVRCTSGAIYDVMVDLRPGSPTRRQWVAAELSASNRRMLFVPPGLAHGYLTMEDHTEVFYQISQFYDPDAARGVRWNDPAFGIEWPGPVEVISPRDAAYADYTT